jgi:hypothetical protein
MHIVGDMHGMMQHAHAATVLINKLHIVGDMREKAACTCSNSVK